MKEVVLKWIFVLFIVFLSCFVSLKFDCWMLENPELIIINDYPLEFGYVFPSNEGIIFYFVLIFSFLFILLFNVGICAFIKLEELYEWHKRHVGPAS